jgi:hypothetical protein
MALQKFSPEKMRSAAPSGGDNDEFPTPVDLAERVFLHFRPKGLVIEPCPGPNSGFSIAAAFREYKPKFHLTEVDGNFLSAPPPDLPLCDWIITNPPWSNFTEFMRQSMAFAKNVVFLAPVNKITTRCRMKMVPDMGYGLVELACCDTPKCFPSSGFQLAAIHWKRGYKGKTKIGELR